MVGVSVRLQEMNASHSSVFNVVETSGCCNLGLTQASDSLLTLELFRMQTIIFSVQRCVTSIKMKTKGCIQPTVCPAIGYCRANA